MHCTACGILIKETLESTEGVSYVHVNEKKNTVEVILESDESGEVIAKNLSALIKKDGYSLSIEKIGHAPKWSEFRYALPIALGILGIFVFLQKIGLVNLITAEKVNLPAAFSIGLVASVSSCLAVVGGLLLSVSANYAKEGEKAKPQIFFHGGRLISFFVFGGLIGLLGSAFTLSGSMVLILGILVSMVMLSLGLNLLDVFPWTKQLQPRMPKFLDHSSRIKNMQHSAVPFLIGLSTFFLPCGFTQSMQVYSLSTGSFLAGALTMLVFALGTLPVLAFISVSSVEFGKGKYSGIFFKVAGLLVIAFGILNVLSSLTAAGIIKPLFNL
jgi:sulfite exporter TauE/SafE/copper chaperone CopZ